MWLEGPDLFKFELAHSISGNNGTGPALILNPDTTPYTVTVASYHSDVSHFIDDFAPLPGGVTVNVDSVITYSR